MSRRGTRFVGGVAAAVAVLTVALDVVRAIDLRWQTTLLVTALAGLAGLAAQRAIALGQRRAAEEERERVLDDALAWWPPPNVEDADPYEVGAFPPESGPYIARAADEALLRALERPGYVVVVGPVGSGKSRAAFEALRRVLPRAVLLVPEDGESLARLIAADPRLPGGEQGSVLWLDCVDRFLSGLRLDAVDRWVSSAHLRVVATIAEPESDRLVASGGPEGHVARRLLARASVVSIDASLGSEEADAARREFPDRDFSDGMGGAFRAAWRAPAAPPALRFAEPDASKSGVRPDLWLSLALAGALCVTALIAVVHFDRGLRAPAPMDRQIAKLKRELTGCGLETFAGDEKNMPIVATVDAGRGCEGHAVGADPVLVYDERDERLRPVYGFGPPGEGFPRDARFGCRGSGGHPCWTDVTGHGEHAIIGVFRDPDTQALLPVAAWRDRERGWRVEPLLTEPPDVAKPFRAEPYRKPVDFGGGRTGYRVADLAVLPAREGDRSLPARAVVGFAPRTALLSPQKLEAQARPLAFAAGVGLHDTCLVVQDGVPRKHLEAPVRDGTLSEALRKRWEKLEEAREGICVLNR
jgi:hypothetical protein